MVSQTVGVPGKRKIHKWSTRLTYFKRDTLVKATHTTNHDESTPSDIAPPRSDINDMSDRMGNAECTVMCDTCVREPNTAHGQGVTLTDVQMAGRGAKSQMTSLAGCEVVQPRVRRRLLARRQVCGTACRRGEPHVSGLRFTHGHMG